jgi:hypothetical protein
MEICRDNPNLVKIGQKYRALYMNILTRFLLLAKLNRRKKRSWRVKWYQAVRIDEGVQTLSERATMSHYTFIALLS